MSAPPARCDPGTAVLSQLAAAYLADRRVFFSQVISLAVSEGYGRRESVAFCKAVTARVREHLAEQETAER